MDAFTCFKPLRNKLRTFNLDSILNHAIEKLHELKSFPIDQVKYYPPFYLLLLIKWAVLYCDPSHSKRRDANSQDFNRLVNMVHAIFGCVRLPSDYSSVYVFLKNMAFQQLWLQGRLSTADLGRQVLLFQKLPRDSLFDRLFEQRSASALVLFLS
jgi:hypothetical protein